jgi:hypothetical protein
LFIVLHSAAVTDIANPGFPYYEFLNRYPQPGERQTGIILDKSDSIKSSIYKQERGVTFVNKDGTACPREFESIEIKPIEECCQGGPRNFVVGILNPDSCSNALPDFYLPYGVKILNVIDVQTLKRAQNCSVFETEELRYEYCDNEVKPDDPLAPKYISRVKKGGKMVFEKEDYSETGVDSYEPFHYGKQDLGVIYELDGKKHYMFRPGYVLIDGERGIRNRKPHLYYGECDCTE